MLCVSEVELKDIHLMLEKPVTVYRKAFFPRQLQSRRDFSTERMQVIG